MEHDAMMRLFRSLGEAYEAAANTLAALPHSPCNIGGPCKGVRQDINSAAIAWGIGWASGGEAALTEVETVLDNAITKS